MTDTFLSGKQSFFIDYLFGGVSAALSKTIFHPVELGQLRFQVATNHGIHLNVIDSLFQTAQKEGLHALWKDNFLPVKRYSSTQAINFALKDFYRRVLKRKNSKNSLWRSLKSNVTAGAAAGATYLTFAYPLQFTQYNFLLEMNKHQTRKQFASLSDCARKMYAMYGVRGFYIGFGNSLPGIVMYRGICFGGYDTIKDTWFKKRNVLSVKFLAAYGVSLAASWLAYPFDVVRKRLMAQYTEGNIRYNGVLNCFKKTIHKEGAGALLRGSSSVMFKSLSSALALVLYDEFQKLLNYSVVGF